MTMTGYWRNVRAVNQRLNLEGGDVVNNVYYLFPQGGGPRGSYTTFADIKSHLRSRDLIILSGVLLEQAVAPDDIYDVTILGACDRPRQATSGGVATGGGASWLAPSSPTAATALLELRSQGWAIENVQFAPVAASPCVQLTRSAAVDTIDASHASFKNCYFLGGGATGNGIVDSGGSGRVLVEECRFELLAGTAIKGVSTGADVPTAWTVRRNQFVRNTNAIGMSSKDGLFEENDFRQAANDTNFKINLVAVAAQGSLNHVINNQFSDAAANVTIAKGYKPGTTDVWRNWVTDSAAMIVTVPA